MHVSLGLVSIVDRRRCERHDTKLIYLYTVTAALVGKPLEPSSLCTESHLQGSNVEAAHSNFRA